MKKYDMVRKIAKTTDLENLYYQINGNLLEKKSAMYNLKNMIVILEYNEHESEVIAWAALEGQEKSIMLAFSDKDVIEENVFGVIDNFIDSMFYKIEQIQDGYIRCFSCREKIALKDHKLDRSTPNCKKCKAAEAKAVKDYDKLFRKNAVKM